MEVSDKLTLDEPESLKNEEPKIRKKGRPKADAPAFPHDPLAKTMKIAESIENNNAGRPYDRLSLAKSIDNSPSSGGFRQLITSSTRYGITEGGRRAEKLSLTPIGSSIVAPTNDSEKNRSLLQALLTPELFYQVYNFFDSKKIPREELFKNSLKKEFGVMPEDVDACYGVIMQNIEDYNLKEEIKGNIYLQLNKLGTLSEIESSPEITNNEDVTDEESTREDVYNTKLTEQKPHLKQIFVAHGKNTKPLEQLKAILDQFEVPYKVAIDEPNQGRPISQKVSELMNECSSSIFIFTKDEETQDLEGNTVYRPSDNVVYELGAASAMFGKKIVIFKENGVSFGSDFKDLGYISFDTDQLGAKTMELMKELVGFGLLKVSAA